MIKEEKRFCMDCKYCQAFVIVTGAYLPPGELDTIRCTKTLPPRFCEENFTDNDLCSYEKKWFERRQSSQLSSDIRLEIEVPKGYSGEWLRDFHGKLEIACCEY